MRAAPRLVVRSARVTAMTPRVAHSLSGWRSPAGKPRASGGDSVRARAVGGFTWRCRHRRATGVGGDTAWTDTANRATCLRSVHLVPQGGHHEVDATPTAVCGTGDCTGGCCDAVDRVSSQQSGGTPMSRGFLSRKSGVLPGWNAMQPERNTLHWRAHDGVRVLRRLGCARCLLRRRR